MHLSSVCYYLFNNRASIHVQCSYLYCNRFITAINENEDQWDAQNCKEHIWKVCLLKIGINLSILFNLCHKTFWFRCSSLDLLACDNIAEPPVMESLSAFDLLCLAKWFSMVSVLECLLLCSVVLILFSEFLVCVVFCWQGTWIPKLRAK